MQNLDQIRAALALLRADDTSKQAVSKLPAMILTHGILAAAAFADEKNEKGQPKREKINHAMDATATHLSHKAHGLTVLKGVTTAETMITKLSSGSATVMDLQRATAEALAFLSYLKRFTTKEETES